ncbi:MAG: 50S ribosomal protein L4 [Gemmatimonadales bacterium]|nr:50S ribosomal protein L4 [Gemmatimonadales bacterium]MDZ4388244.1 50S ribosomal protein L4 [Gemmatimonadales bacterium]
MIEAPRYTALGEPQQGAFALPADLFDGTVNEAVLHQAVKTYLGNQRQGTHKVKTRAEVSGGNQKPWKQKGTGRARQGTTRAPHWRGGGIVFGPSPRDYRTDIPKKVRQLARRSGFNAKAREGNLHVIEALSYEAPKTSRVLALVERLGLSGKRVLILTDGNKPEVHLSARNVPRLEVLPFVEATAYDLLLAEAVVVEAAALAAKEGA